MAGQADSSECSDIRHEIFELKHGNDMYVFSNAYVNREKGNPQMAEMYGDRFNMVNMMENFAPMILAHIDSQPDQESREEWFATFLKDMEGLRR